MSVNSVVRALRRVALEVHALRRGEPAALEAIEALLRAGERTPVRARELGTLDDATRHELRERARAPRKQLDAPFNTIDRK